MEINTDLSVTKKDLKIMIEDIQIKSWDELFMRHVYLIAQKSKDKYTKIGAVLVKNNSIIGEGYNGIPRNVSDSIEERQERPEKYFWFEHAERNAIYNCARVGISTENAVLYTQGVPCADCARGIINSGIVEIVVHEQFENDIISNMNQNKWIDSATRSYMMFKETKIKYRIFSGKLNMKTLVGGKVFEI